MSSRGMTSGKGLLPYGRHHLDDDDVEAVTAVLKGDALTTGPMTPAFEEALAGKVGARHAVACSSGTAGLHLALLALGAGPGDSVLVPTVTFVATANVVRHVGAEVVFADVDADTGLMGAPQFAEALERAGEARFKAVMPVHLGGQCVDPDGIARLAGERGIHVVEDACHALGAAHGHAPVGACRHAEMAVFSFHPVKAIAMGEGGAVTTNDAELGERVALLRNHGMTREARDFENDGLAFAADGSPNPWYYEMPEAGFNYRVSDIQCALGLSQLGKLDRFIARRRWLAARYDELLAPFAPLLHPVGRIAGCGSAWHLYQVLIDFGKAGIGRAEFMALLMEEGIGSQVHYIPVHGQPYYRHRYGKRKLPGAEAFYARALTLPLFPGMDDGDPDRVAEALGRILRP